MTKKELIEAIADYPDDAQIIIQKDGEGNSYSPMYCADIGYYVPATTWSGEFYGTDLSPDDCAMDNEEHERLTTNHLAIVFVPIN